MRGMPRLSPRDRRAVARGSLVAGPVLAWMLVVSPYLAAVGGARDRLTAERALLARERAAVAAAAGYPDAFEAGAERLLAEAPRLFGGSDDGAAAADLARYLRRLAPDARVHLTGTEPGPARLAGEGVVALPLEAAGESDLEGVLTLLRMLEGGPKLVRVEALRVEGPPARRSAFLPSAPGAAAGPQTVTFRLSLVGYSLAGSAPFPTDEEVR